jgi:hypothetical protein
MRRVPYVKFCEIPEALSVALLEVDTSARGEGGAGYFFMAV